MPGKLIGPQSPNHAQSLDPTKIIEWTNKYRQDNGLKPLETNKILTLAAQNKTDDMITTQYFDHVSPSGKTPAQLVAETGYNYKTTGENLALGDFKDEKDLVDAWMASPGHRANILNKSYTEIGVASGLGNIENRNTWLAVQEFGKPAPNCTNPNKNLSNDINAQKTEYEKLSQNLSALANEAKSLSDQANTQIKQGNAIYQETGKTAQAETYWQKGEELKAQADKKFAQAKELQKQMDTLYGQIDKLIKQYNSQVNSYNVCIK